jgi:class 3 adenylate cyclase
LNHELAKQTILVIDDTPFNIDVIDAVLSDTYIVKSAESGEEALKVIAEQKPDLILLDVMMPDIDGYELCQRLKNDANTRDIPVIFLTAKTEVDDEFRGFELGAVDYITKPISAPILQARIQTQLALYNAKRQLEELNQSLEKRVSDGVEKIERLDRLKRFFSPAVANILLTDQAQSYLTARRREIVVVFLDLRGYTKFTEDHAPEVVMGVIGEFHNAMGDIIMAYDGTLERFTGDGMMIFFNDPVEIPDPALQAVNMAVAMQYRMVAVCEQWQEQGLDLSMSVGIAQGMATIGAIGFEGRRDYAALGRVTNLAARLCGEARGGQILCSEVVVSNLHGKVQATPIPDLTLKGFTQPIKAFEIDKSAYRT